MDKDERRRRTLILVGIIALFLLTIVAIYFVFFSRTPSDPSDEGPTFGEISGEREGTPIHRDNDRNNNTGVFAPTARLRLISEEPVAGSTTILNNNNETVRFLERKTSHVFDSNLETLEKSRVSGTTIPRIYEALWTSGGEGVILRYLTENNRTIKTYYANLVEKEGETEEGEAPFEFSGNFLEDNISQISLSPNKNQIFTLTESLRGSRGIISNPDGSEGRATFNSDFNEWLPQWFGNNRINMTTKASGLAPGFSYSMPTSSGELDRRLGNVVGLTTLTSPDGKYILYSQSEDNSMRSHIHNTETGESNQLFIRLLPEKCAWASNTILYCGVPDLIPSGLYPDIWYQGKVLFTDSIFRIDAEINDARKVYSPLTEDEEAIDIYKPFVSESGDYLIFNDKASMSLWAFTINARDRLNIPDPSSVEGL